MAKQSIILWISCIVLAPLISFFLQVPTIEKALADENPTDTRLSQSQVTAIADKHAQEKGYETANYKSKIPTFATDRHEWYVHYEAKPKIIDGVPKVKIGDHFGVVVDDETSSPVRIVPGK